MKTLRTAIFFLLLMSLLLGVAYPAGVWFIGSVLFPHESEGSLLRLNGAVVGSALIGQPFSSDRYFWPRPSATKGEPYQALSSGASNLNARNPLLLKQIKERSDKIFQAHPGTQRIPVDLVTASASGLDPDISVAAALVQAERVAAARKIDSSLIQQIIRAQTIFPDLGFLGTERVNVLRLNMALDHIQVGEKK